MKIKVSNTTTLQLDWLVLKANGAFNLHLQSTYGTKTAWVFSERDDEDPERVNQQYLADYSASTDWNIGGPIIDREGINLRAPDDAKRPDGTVVLKIDYWYARVTRYHSKNGTEYVQNGPTPLIAAMRCFVASRLGDEVEVPDDLA